MWLLQYPTTILMAINAHLEKAFTSNWKTLEAAKQTDKIDEENEKERKTGAT